MTLTLPELISLLGLLVTIVGIFGTIIWNLWKKVMEDSKSLDDFKLDVARRYASFEHINSLETKLLVSEERLHGSIKNLTERIDRILTRLEPPSR